MNTGTEEFVIKYMNQSKDDIDEMPESCKLAEQHQTESMLDQVAEQEYEELGYVLPVMGELYNEMNHSDPAEAILNSEECQIDSTESKD